MVEVYRLALAMARVPLRLKLAILSKTKGVSNSEWFHKGLSSFSDEEAKSFEECKGLLSLRDAEKELQFMETRKCEVLLFGDENYPKLLLEIPDPPAALFVEGKANLEGLLLGFVGPRKPSAYGARIARMLAEDCVREGLILVSGLARGIDAIAHESSIRRRQPTIAIMASGLDQTYPREHASLRESILENGGAIVAENPKGTPALAANFPRRNRIISGLSRGVLLIEAAEKSGGRVTARCALEQNREVYAVPGPIDSPLSYWPNRLISEGAKMVRSSEDILEDYFDLGSKREEDHYRKRTSSVELSEAGGTLFRKIDFDEPQSADDLARALGWSLPQILQVLMELEMKGVVERRADARYARR